jgi:hypothetical protein
MVAEGMPKDWHTQSCQVSDSITVIRVHLSLCVYQEPCFVHISCPWTRCHQCSITFIFGLSIFVSCTKNVDSHLIVPRRAAWLTLAFLWYWLVVKMMIRNLPPGCWSEATNLGNWVNIRLHTLIFIILVVVVTPIGTIPGYLTANQIALHHGHTVGFPGHNRWPPAHDRGPTSFPHLLAQ